MANPGLQLKQKHKRKLKTRMKLLCCSLTSLNPCYRRAWRSLSTLEGRTVLRQMVKISLLSKKSLQFTVIKCLNAMSPFEINTEAFTPYVIKIHGNK